MICYCLWGKAGHALAQASPGILVDSASLLFATVLGIKALSEPGEGKILHCQQAQGYANSVNLFNQPSLPGLPKPASTERPATAAEVLQNNWQPSSSSLFLIGWLSVFLVESRVVSFTTIPVWRVLLLILYTAPAPVIQPGELKVFRWQVW